jgi:hypothetical protein
MSLSTPISSDILDDIEKEISSITESIRFNMYKSLQYIPYKGAYILGVQTIHNMSNTMENMRMPETPNQFQRLPDVLLDNILMYLTPIMMTSLRSVSRRFCYESRRINLLYTNKYYPGLNLWVMYSDKWVVGRILPCGINGVTEIIYDTYQVNEFHIQISVGTTVAVKTIDVLAKISLLHKPPMIPKYVENTDFNNPHDVCSCGVYTGTCNNNNPIAPKSSCWILYSHIKQPSILEIGTVCKFPNYSRMQSHIDMSMKIEKKYGVSYNKYLQFSIKHSKMCIKTFRRYENICLPTKPIYSDMSLAYHIKEAYCYRRPDEDIFDIFDMLD